MGPDIGLLVVRALLGFVLFAHATQKLLGWFHGPGLGGATTVFEALGQRPGRRMAVLASLCELVAAVLLALGIATPVGVAVGTGTMLVAGAASTMRSGSRWNTGGGGEYPLVLAVVVATVGFTGPGGYSVDAVLGLATLEADVRVGAIAAAVAIVVAAFPIARTRRELRPETRVARTG